MSLPSSSQIRQMTSARDVLNARDAANAALRRSSSPAIREQAGAVHTTAQRRLDELQGRDPQRIQAQADRSTKSGPISSVRAWVCCPARSGLRPSARQRRSGLRSSGRSAEPQKTPVPKFPKFPLAQGAQDGKVSG